ncbi:MAG: hypothetical protein ACMXYG_07480 [Candidatus Woesearchaeota archaeon]
MKNKNNNFRISNKNSYKKIIAFMLLAVTILVIIFILYIASTREILYLFDQEAKDCSEMNKKISLACKAAISGDVNYCYQIEHIGESTLSFFIEENLLENCYEGIWFTEIRKTINENELDCDNILSIPLNEDDEISIVEYSLCDLRNLNCEAINYQAEQLFCQAVKTNSLEICSMIDNLNSCPER